MPSLLLGDQKCQEISEREKKEEKMLSILKYYEMELKRDPRNPKLLGALGDAYYSLRHFPEAISAYEKMLALNPNNNSIKINLANSYLSNGNEVKSRELFLEVLNNDPKNSQALAGIGRLEALLGHFNDAEQLYKHSLNIYPYN
jgi:tetratricopeptide (TPR) repeat protein